MKCLLCEGPGSCSPGTASGKTIRGSGFTGSVAAGPKSSQCHGTRPSPSGQEVSGFRCFRERKSRDLINIYVGRNISRLKHQIKSRQMKYDHKDWIKPLESLGRFKSSLVWKRESLVFSSVSAPLTAFPRAWSMLLLLKINHSGRLRQPSQGFRCSELKKRRKSHKKRMDEAVRRCLGEKWPPPAPLDRGVSRELSSHWG